MSMGTLRSPIRGEQKLKKIACFSWVRNPLRNGKRTRAILKQHDDLVRQAGQPTGIKSPKSPLK